jgi:DnaJ domain
MRRDRWPDARPEASSVDRISHYDVLGVPSTATAAEIREAYRRAARRHHPDQRAAAGSPDGSLDAMAAINEAYRVLRDPARRAVYDAGRRSGTSAVPPAASAPRRAPTAVRSPVPVDTTGPARYPWKLVLGMAVLGVAIVLTGAALARPSRPAPPDNILETGSCVEIEYTGDAREVNCTGSGDLVVRTIVPFDESCPPGTSAHRDRQGLGNACIEPALATP